MEKLQSASLLLLAMSVCYSTSTAEVKVEIRNPIHYGEPAVGSCLVSGLRYPRFQFIKVGLKDGRESCSITLANKLGINRPYLTRNFTITCTNNTRSVTIECYVITVINGIDRKQVDVVPPPKIVNKSENVTTARLGLPVTLSCHVEGDPSNYWVGWIHKESILQDGDQHSMSTFTSHNGTSHYLTVHTVKTAGEYECKVFTIEGRVQDHMTHQINTEEGNEEEIPKTSSSLLNSLRSFLF